LIRAAGAFAHVRGAASGKRAIAFHEVPDVSGFENFLDWLGSEYEIVGLDDWLTGPTGERTQVLLTFDDGYAAWQTAVAPLLAERNAPALFFVTSGLVGLSGAEAAEFARARMLRTQELEFISQEQLRDLAAHKSFEIGSHTRSHPDLARIQDRGVLRDEIVGARATLEDWLGARVRAFAYPFGTPANVSDLARSVLEEGSFEAAVTLIPGGWTPAGGDRLAIGRDALDPAFGRGLARAWLRGGYDRLYALKPGA
jgi:peptidoglycan/xylan/chitin deacetylase (PgdA/CDA1 family)